MILLFDLLCRFLPFFRIGLSIVSVTKPAFEGFQAVFLAPL